MEDYKIVEISSRQDDLLIPWMQIYEQSFPPPERVMFATLLTILREKEAGKNHTHRILALTTSQGDLIGLACDQFIPVVQVGYLWYLATQPDLRSQGLGTWLYQYMMRTMLAQARLVIFEVERPDLAETPEQQQLAERRIQFYRRNGARLLYGIDYIQSVGNHVPPVPMHLMIHDKEEHSVEDIYSAAKAIFHEALQQTGILRIE